jgi:DNA primase
MRGTRPRPGAPPPATRFRANEQAAELYAQMLADGKEADDARAYVEERGISPEAVEMFGVGFAPGYPDFLLRRLSQARDLSPEILLEAGLATRGDDGTVRGCRRLG